MTLQEILKSQGLTDEQVKKVVGEMKQNKIFTTALENADIRYNDLKGKHDALEKEHKESTSLIDQLKNGDRGNDALKSKINEYEKMIDKLKTENEQIRVDSALKAALLEAKVTDVNYIAFKVKELGEVKLDENGNIKGISDTLAALKTQYPQHFSSESQKKIDENKLNGSDYYDKGMTRAEFMKKPYSERQQFYNEHPDQFAEIMNS